MNALSEIVHAPPHWHEVIRSANAWRGQAIHLFAKAEWAVTETLLVLADVPVRGDKVRFGNLLGQRLDGLRQAVGAKGPFAPEGATASEALAAFEPFEKMRPALCHGASRVTVDPQGRWQLVLRMIEIKVRAHEVRTTAYDQQDAELKLRELQRCVQRLVAALSRLRNAIVAAPAQPPPVKQANKS